MADTPDKNPKKPAPPANSRLAEAQKRAAALAAGNGRKLPSAGTFFKEAWVELKKTTWPTKEVLTKSTTVVLALVLAVAIWVGGLDYLLTKIMTPLFSAR